jgi:uncharacterized protein YndB with AHSA1/START domain
MPIKKDQTGKHWVEMHFTVPGTPEQVWQAMATGPGNGAWFTKATIEERVGGSLKFHFGAEMSSSGEVTMWEPPHLFGYVERQWSEGAPPIATEITIANRAGGQCVVRMVHSLFSSTGDWDDQLEGFESGWTGFIEVLRIYLANFAGMKAASFQVMHSVQAEHSAVWSKILEKLSLAGANVGDRYKASQPEALSGLVEQIHQDQKIRVITLRLDAPAPGVAIVGTYGTSNGANASVSAFFYGDTAEAQVARSQLKWQQWIREAMSF